MFHVKQFSDTQQQEQELNQALLDRALLRLQKIVVGNGVKKSDVLLREAKGQVYTIKAQLNLLTAARVRDEVVPGRRPVGEVVDKGQAAAAAQDYAESMGQNEQFQKTVRQIIQRRPAQGFGLNREAIIVESASTAISEVDHCRPCQGEGQIHCAHCQARGQASCEKCRGMRESQCYVCRGQGFTPGVNGQETQCYACHGRRVLQCDMCRGVGQVTCRLCQGKGRVSCAQCQGKGAATYVVHVSVDAMPEFTIEQSNLPTPLYNTLLARGPQRLAAKGHLEVSMRSDDDDAMAEKPSFYGSQKKKGWQEHYEAQCPWGDVAFTLAGKVVQGNVMGRKALLVNMPYILDDLLGDMIKRLNGAAKGKLSPAAVLERACRRRITREALPVLLAKGRKACLSRLGKAYPFGLSAGAGKAMIAGLAGVVSRMTRLPAYAACLAALIGLSGVLGIWFFVGLRSMALAGLPIGAGFVADLALAALLGYLSILIIRMTEHVVLKRFFKRLKLPMTLLSRLPRAGGVEMVSLAGSAIVTLTFLWLAGEKLVPWIGLIGK